MWFAGPQHPAVDPVFESGPTTTTTVGLRTASNDIDANGNALFKVNGKKILVRGGGYAPDLLQVIRPMTSGEKEEKNGRDTA